ncbi:unnamed protein product [Alternaria alternata]
MADPGISATFSDLPTEMKATIFGYLQRNDHKKSACLVSRSWRDIMAPILWEHLTLRVAPTLPGELACLLNPNDGVLTHVRSIDIRAGLDGTAEFEMDSEFGIAFQFIFGALQKNCLPTLKFHIDINMTTLLKVLQPQQALKTLRLRSLTFDASPSSNLGLSTHTSWVTPTLRNIKKLRIPIDDGKHSAYESSAYLLKNTPNLKELSLFRIAKHQNLRTLRMLTVPNVDYEIIPNPSILEWIGLADEDVYTSQVMMQAFATEVFRLFARNGSNIRALAMSPQYTNPAKQPFSDDNGHQWPRYFYRYGATRTMSGQEYIIAVPTPLDEFPVFGPTYHG